MADSDKEKPANRSKEDDELSQLLDSSLQDFGKSNVNPSRDDDITEVKIEDPDPEDVRQAACDFQKMLQHLAEVQKVVMHQQSSTSAATSMSAPNAESSAENDAADNSEEPDELFLAQAFLQNMQFLAGKAQKVQDATTTEEFSNAMKELGEDDTYEKEFMPFMHGLMGSLLAKDMLYPPMKEMCEKYPVWLADNKSKLDEKTFSTYEAQLKLMQDACKEYEDEKPEDSEQEQAQRMDRLMIYMQKIQACGYPPEDLVGTLPPGWSLDPQSGLPKAVDMEKAAEACSLM